MVDLLVRGLLCGLLRPSYWALMTDDKRTIRKYEQLRYVNDMLEASFNILSGYGMYYVANKVQGTLAFVRDERLDLHADYIEAKNRQSKGVTQ